MKALVTGGAGFLGSHLVDALMARGDEVTVVDNLRRGRISNLSRHSSSANLTLYTSDVRDYPSLVSATCNIDVVFHLAAQSNVLGALSDPDYSFTTNVLGTFNILKAASAQGVRRVVFASSREVYGEPDAVPVPEDSAIIPKNHYGASKVAGEAYCYACRRVGGVECQVLRFTNIYGRRDYGRVIPTWLEQARRGEDLNLYGGQQVLDFLWVDHAVAALLAASVCHNTGPINVGSGKGTRLTDLSERIVGLVGSSSNIRRLAGRDAEVVHFVADVGNMSQVLGINPPDDPLDGLVSLVSS